MKAFFHALLLLLIITDPLGNIPLFIAALGRVSPERRPRVIWRESLVAFLILAAAMLVGRSLMGLLGLSDESIKAAGGVILFLIAINMVFPGSGARLGEGPSQGEPFIVPIAVPLISGPSAMAMAMLIAAEDPSRMLEWIAALILCIGVTVLVLFASGRIKELLGEQVLVAIERLMGLILTAVAIDMMLNGAAAYIERFIARG